MLFTGSMARPRFTSTRSRAPFRFSRAPASKRVMRSTGERSFDGHFVMGRLRVITTALHAAGDVTPIRSGPGGLIHALFHLDRPSVSIVVRTYHDETPALSSTLPGRASAPILLRSRAIAIRALQLVGLIRNVDHPSLERWVGDLVARSDLHTAYRTLEGCMQPSRSLPVRSSDRPRSRSRCAGSISGRRSRRSGGSPFFRAEGRWSRTPSSAFSWAFS